MRRYRGKSVRDGEATGIGIQEISQGESVQIYSLYYDKRLSRRDIATEILKIVYLNIVDDPKHSKFKATLETCVDNFKTQWCRPYRDLIKIEGRKYRPRYEEVYLLAQDALERRYTIKEEL